MHYSVAAILLCCACSPPSKSLGSGDGSADGSDSDATATEGSASESASDTSGGTQGSDSDSDSDSDSASGSGTDGSVCEDAMADAMAFLNDNRACQDHADCVVEGGSCYDGSLEMCGLVPVNRAADGSAWQTIHETLATCTECDSEPCAPESFCNEQGRCDLRLPRPTQCNFEEEVCALLEQSKDALDNAQNCGYLDLGAPEADWISAQQCALDAQQTGTGFKLIWDVQGIDSFPSQAVVGIQGRSYATFELFHDEGGLAGGQFTSSRECTSLSATPDCTPSVGQMCLTCDDPTELETTCEAPG